MKLGDEGKAKKPQKCFGCSGFFTKLKIKTHVQSKEVKANTFLNLADLESLDKLETLDFERDKDREDPDVLVHKFEQLCLPVRKSHGQTRVQHDQPETAMPSSHISPMNPCIYTPSLAHRGHLLQHTFFNGKSGSILC